MRVTDLTFELHEVAHQTWFVQRITELDVTDDALRARLAISEGLFIQVFLSDTTGRCSFALVQGNQRVYGRDREGGSWDRHPYQDPSRHELTPQAIPPHPLRQFMTEVEEILVTAELI